MKTDGGRFLTAGEVDLARSIFGDRLATGRIELRRTKAFFLQPHRIVLAPRGHIHFHPACPYWRDDFSAETIDYHAFLLHELCHIWQHQSGLNLAVRRHPLCRYRYRLVPGKPFLYYGIEQQAEIVRHAYLARHGIFRVAGATSADYETLLAVFRDDAPAPSA